MSVRNGLAVDKGVCQFELPIYVYHDMRQSLPADPSVRQSLDEKRNLQVWEKVYLMESGFSRKFCPSAQDWGQNLLTS